LTLKEKIKYLKSYDASIRVYVLEGVDAVNKFNKYKQLIRKTIPVEINKFITLHAPDSIKERDYMLNVALNNNFFDNFKKISHGNMSDLNYRLLFNFRQELLNNNLNSENVCIVGGMALSIYGIRESSGDIDITVDNKIRTHVGDDSRALTSTVDVVYKNHFYFMGYKVINIDLLYERKKQDKRDKDIQDVEAIKNFLALNS